MQLINTDTPDIGRINISTGTAQMMMLGLVAYKKIDHYLNYDTTSYNKIIQQI